MKTPLFIITLLGLLVSFGGTSFARPWTEFVGKGVINPGDYDRISEFYEAKQAPFRKLLTQWESKEDQIKQIELLTKSGITKKIAEKAIAERLKLAREVVKSNFKGVEDISPALDRLENTVHVLKKIAGLGHERLQSVMKAQGIKLKKGFYSCLCNYYSSAGTGIGYSPPRDKHCNNTNPCKGGNWGCASYDLPKNPERYAYCAKKHKTGKGVNIFQAITQNFNSGKKLSLGRNKGDKKPCLATLFDFNLNDLGGLSFGSTAKQAIDIANNSKNLCEQAVSMNLFLNSQRGNSNFDIAFKSLAIWILPNNFDMTAGASNAAGKLSQSYASSLVKTISGKALSVISKTKNIYDIAKILYLESDTRRLDIYYKEAYDLFAKSKNWTSRDISSNINKIEKELDEVRDGIIRSENDLRERLNTAHQIAMLKAVAALKDPKDKRRPDLALRFNPLLREKLRIKRRKLREEAQERQIRRLHKLENLTLKQNILVKYRKPFSEHGCKKYIEDMESSCKNKLAQQRKKQRVKLESLWQSALESAARTRKRLSVGEKNTLSGGVGGHVPGTEPKR